MAKSSKPRKKKPSLKKRKEQVKYIQQDSQALKAIQQAKLREEYEKFLEEERKFLTEYYSQDNFERLYELEGFFSEYREELQDILEDPFDKGIEYTDEEWDRAAELEHDLIEGEMVEFAKRYNISPEEIKMYKRYLKCEAESFDILWSLAS